MSDAESCLPKRVRPGNLDALRRKVWRAILAAELLLEHESPEIRLRAIHATSQAGSTYRAIIADSELEGIVADLERRAEKAKL